MKKVITCLFLSFSISLIAQEEEKVYYIDGEVLTAEIDSGDTLFVAKLDDLTVTSPRVFESAEDRRLYYLYRRYAAKVYPYAVESIKIFRELERDEQEMNKRQRRRHIRQLNREYKDEFKDPLKGLTKTQGRILVRMIERELDTPLYFLIKDLRGGLSARWWNEFSRLYGYELRRGYVIGDDPILDMVLEDFDVSYEVKDKNAVPYEPQYEEF